MKSVHRDSNGESFRKHLSSKHNIHEKNWKKKETVLNMLLENLPTTEQERAQWDQKFSLEFGQNSEDTEECSKCPQLEEKVQKMADDIKTYKQLLAALGSAKITEKKTFDLALAEAKEREEQIKLRHENQMKEKQAEIDVLQQKLAELELKKNPPAPSTSAPKKLCLFKTTKRPNTSH